MKRLINWIRGWLIGGRCPHCGSFNTKGVYGWYKRDCLDCKQSYRTVPVEFGNG